MERVKLWLAILSGVLFVGNYHICEFIYPDNIDMWWHLRLQIYAICFLLFCIVAAIKQKSDVRFILYIVMAFIAGDVWDRLTTAGIATFVNSDYVLIGFLIIIIILYVRNKVRNARQIQNRTRNT